MKVSGLFNHKTTNPRFARIFKVEDSVELSLPSVFVFYTSQKGAAGGREGHCVILLQRLRGPIFGVYEKL